MTLVTTGDPEHLSETEKLFEKKIRSIRIWLTDEYEDGIPCFKARYQIEETGYE